ncbi:protein of unknown function [Natronincola peptidivorans]|uniref:Uncharacterized protein n=1 Tax=Natronincola peptidivorans TaxID=426128 RepID=A0A1I0F3H7_9FIRM|nr:DUF927 domain-containing protein [Natronincola peptidivorans]SET51582.1 protein of unknown function [Natronincola peptidivorans]
MDDKLEENFPKKKREKSKNKEQKAETNEKERETLDPPSNPVYKPYLQRLRHINEFDLDNQGNLCSYDKNGSPYRLSNFVAMPTKEIIRDDGVSQERTFRIKGIRKGGYKLPPVDISPQEFVGMNWVISNWGIETSIKAGMGKKDIVRDAIQNMGENIKKHTIFTHIGWRQEMNNKYTYLHSEGGVGETDVTVELEEFLKRYKFPNKIPSTKKAAQESLSLLKLATEEVTIPLLALVYLAPLVEVFKRAGIEPNFVMWLHGNTGTRKTTLAMLYLCHFGNFNGKNPPASFKDTANALERKAFATKDSLLLIDDFHPESSKSEASKINQTAQRILRMYGDRIGRGRLTSTIEFQKDYPPRGMALVTGEDVPKGQSSVARFLGVEILNDEINLKLLTRAQKNNHLLSQSMVGYIKWLIPQMDELPQKIAKRFQNKRSYFQGESAHGRLGDAATCLMIAFELMLEYMIEVGACNKKMAQILSKMGDRVLISLITKQNSLVRQEKPVEIFKKVLEELLSTGKVRLEPINTIDSFNQVKTEGERIGWTDKNYYYLLPDTTYNVVCRFLASRGEIFPVKERTLWKHLDEAKLILVEKGKDGQVQRCPKKTIPRNTRSSNLGKSYRPRLLHIKRDIFEGELKD